MQDDNRPITDTVEPDFVAQLGEIEGFTPEQTRQFTEYLAWLNDRDEAKEAVIKAARDFINCAIDDIAKTGLALESAVKRYDAINESDPSEWAKMG